MAILLIDMDEVVAGLLERAVELFNQDQKFKVPLSMFTDWDANGRTLEKYFTMEGIYRELPVIKDSQMVLRELSINHDIFFVTAAPTPRSAMEKKEWVDEHFPFIGQRKVITTYDKYLINGDLLFDDSPEFLPKFPKIKVLMEQPYNKDTKADYRVKDWIAFLKLIEFLETNGDLKRKGE